MLQHGLHFVHVGIATPARQGRLVDLTILALMEPEVSTCPRVFDTAYVRDYVKGAKQAQKSPAGTQKLSSQYRQQLGRLGVPARNAVGFIIRELKGP